MGYVVQNLLANDIIVESALQRARVDLEFFVREFLDTLADEVEVISLTYDHNALGRFLLVLC